MTNPLIRYPLDTTGVNPDNAVINEVHALSTAQVRALAPIYGPFFADSLVINDNGNNRLLVKGVSYQIVELLQEASLKYGKEISQLVLITDLTVSTNVRLSYQTLGGLYQNNASGIVNMYETIMKDDRPIDWGKVSAKPVEYPPTLHNHYLEDIYGFESVVFALERLRNSIVLSDVPAFEALISWVKSKVNDIPVVTVDEIDSALSVPKFVTFDKLLYAMKSLNFNSLTLSPTLLAMDEGASQRFDISSTNFPDNTVLYWTVEHISTEFDDFNSLSGIINIVGNRGFFNLALANQGAAAETDELFKVVIRKSSVAGPVIAETGIMSIKTHGSFGENIPPDIMSYVNACCVYNPGIAMNATSMYIVDNT